MRTGPISGPAAAGEDRQEQWRRHALHEARRAALYRRLSELEGDTPLGRALHRLSELEAAHAAHWSGRLQADGRAAPLDLDFGGRVQLWLARRFGVRAVLPALAADPLRAVAAYRSDPDAVAVLDSELEVASRMAAASAPALDQARRRPVTSSGTLRAAVFGVNDGLVSNLSLVMGVAGAAPPQEFVLLAGLAGMLAGAFSMAAGEFISVLSQRELLARQLAVEQERIARAPEAVRAQLADKYREKGIPETEAEAIADHLLADPTRALETVAREQLGVDPDDLGSPLLAASASFISFALGAVVPIVPFLLSGDWTAMLFSALVSILALFLVGVGVSFFTARHFLVSGLRMLGIGAAAAGVTFAIGRLVGISLAG